MTARPTRVEQDNQNHLIGEYVGNTGGPTLIAIGSIHGNEPSGRLALEKVAVRLESLKEKLRGRVYLLVGNVRASSRGVRYVDADLNRRWTTENIRRTTLPSSDSQTEDYEQHELLTIFREILQSAGEEVYVLDLHSTSAGGVPFATVGDTLRNRRFAQKLPVTILLGIEEQLEGTMLEFLNNEGAVTLGFEAGQHLAKESIDNHEALVVQALLASGILSSKDVQDLSSLRDRLVRAGGKGRIFEVRHREAVLPVHGFLMNPGFQNFDRIRRGQVLATNRHGMVKAPESGLILMPLYQKQGDDGFFLVRMVASFWLWLSEIVRRLNVANYIHLLPGVRRRPKRPEILHIDTSIARFFPLQVFHLLGFRRLRWQNNFLVVSRRRFDSLSPFRNKTSSCNPTECRGTFSDNPTLHRSD